jgi:hypothetical protein
LCPEVRGVREQIWNAIPNARIRHLLCSDCDDCARCVEIFGERRRKVDRNRTNARRRGGCEGGGGGGGGRGGGGKYLDSGGAKVVGCTVMKHGRSGRRQKTEEARDENDGTVLRGAIRSLIIQKRPFIVTEWRARGRIEGQNELLGDQMEIVGVP